MERKDAWSEQDDKTLADTVLEHIRSGSTQLAAFEEVAQRLERTAAACGFRFNSEVRKHYVEAIQQAKLERNQNMKNRNKRIVTVSSTPIRVSDPLKLVAVLTEEVSKILNDLQSTRDQLERVREAYRVVQDENELLKRKLFEEKPQEALGEDYQTLVRILDNARKMGFIKSENTDRAAFKMDANGNLERVENQEAI